ncbi:hypothetical protein ABZX74_35150 [Streptomyces olivaceoviridis]|uniref:hypothetical protein n=1 Tax=Streptomyces olivaceoviridis TaxID=1921 RepID=UPI0033B8CC7D
MRTEKVVLSYDEGAPGIAPMCCLPVKEQRSPNGGTRRAAFPPLRVRAADTQGGTVTRTAIRATDLG